MARINFGIKVIKMILTDPDGNSFTVNGARRATEQEILTYDLLEDLSATDRIDALPNK